MPESASMAHRHDMSFKRLDNLHDYIRHGRGLKVDCLRCGHGVKLRPTLLLQFCQAKGWPGTLPEIQKRLRCGICGAKRVHIGTTVY